MGLSPFPTALTTATALLLLTWLMRTLLVLTLLALPLLDGPLALISSVMLLARPRFASSRAWLPFPLMAGAGFIISQPGGAFTAYFSR